MSTAIIILIGAQLLFTTSDLMARHFMVQQGFAVATFFSIWFLVYVLIRIVAMFGQLYVFTTIELGKTMALFGATSIVLANILGFLVLRETLSPMEYVGVTVAVIAFLLLAINPSA